MREWLKQKIKNRTKTDFLIMILIGVLVLIVMIPTGTKETSGKSKLTGNKSSINIKYCFTKFKMICIDDMPFHYLIDKPCGGCNHGNRKKK